MQVLTRRSFLQKTVGAAVALGGLSQLQRAIAASAAATKAAKVGGFLIGAQCWTFRNFSVLEAIEMTAKAGGSIVEFFPGQKFSKDAPDQKWSHDSTDDQHKIVEECCAKNKITPMNYGVTGVPKDEKGARKIFEFAKRWQMHGITTESDDNIDLLEKLAAEYDLKVCFHNHPQRKDNPGYKVWNPEYIRDLVKDRHANVGACADTGHWVTSGLDPVAALKTLKGRIHSTHFKERNELGKAGDMIFGTGKFAAAQFEELRAQGFSGNCSIEYEINWDKSLPDVTQCVDYLRKLGQDKGWS